MIECSEKNIYYRRKRKSNGRFKRFSVFFFVFLIFSIIFLYYKFCIAKQILSLSEEYSYSYSIDSVNKAVLSSTDKDLVYNELVSVSKNNDGQIELILLNSQKINRLNREIADKSKSILESKLSDGISVPLLAFSGIGILKGYGPTVKFKSIYVVSVECDFLSKFESVGINQTLHSLYISVTSKVNVDMALTPKTVESTTEILVSEVVLVGKVPEVYLN